MTKSNLFYRLDDQGNAVILHAEDGSAVTRIDASVYPIGSSFSTRYEHPEGIILSVDDARKLNIPSETNSA